MIQWEGRVEPKNSVGPLSIPDLLEKHGFAIVPGVLSPADVDEMIEQIQTLLDAGPNRSAHALRHLADMAPAVRRVAESAAVRGLVELVLGADALFLVRSLFFDKTPEANWKVAWHQDLTITVRQRIEVPGFTAWSVKDGVNHVQAPVELLEQMLTVRLHLDECASTNGPLSVIPGSHKSGRLNARQITKWRERVQPVICLVPRGGALLMRPLILHASSAATQPKHRRVVHLEFAAESLPGGLGWF